MSGKPEYGSDIVVDVLKSLGIEYAAMNPGASFRGIHDSIVNYGGNTAPETILCNHEQIAVAIAHGYAMASGRPMAAIIHNIVGLLHAAHPIYGAWLARVPVYIIGGAGPMAQEKRRPWTDWIHTALVQGNAVRDFVKWDDQPNTLPGLVDSMIRAYQLAVIEPQGPTYICVDAELQEQRLDPAQIPAVPGRDRHQPPTRVQGDPAALRMAAEILIDAERPGVMADRLGRTPGAVNALQELAELLGIAVIDPICRRGTYFSFPGTHPLDVTGAEQEYLSSADALVSLDMTDPSALISSYQHHGMQRTSKLVTSLLAPGCKYIDITLRHFHWRSWSQDYGILLPADLSISADVSLAVPALTAICRELLGKRPELQEKIRRRTLAISAKHDDMRKRWAAQALAASSEKPIALSYVCRELGETIRKDDWVLCNGNQVITDWARRLWDWVRPDQYVRGGAGLGNGPGSALGVALAHRNKGKMVVSIQPDGDMLFTPTSLWTAAHHRIPVLTVMFNNRSYYNDEMHQESMAKIRGRCTENKGIGTRIEDPPVDFANMARSFGVYGDGPIDDPGQLRPALEKAAKFVRERQLPALVDVVCQPR